MIKKTQENKDLFSKKIETLALEILENSGVHRKYSDITLADTMIIFTEVLLAKTHDKHCKELDQKGLEMLATELGKSLHTTVKLFAGVDLHKVYKK